MVFLLLHSTFNLQGEDCVISFFLLERPNEMAFDLIGAAGLPKINCIVINNLF